MNAQDKPVRVLVAGLGNMGRSHALAYHTNPGFQITALVNRSEVALPSELEHYPRFDDYSSALDYLDRVE